MRYNHTGLRCCRDSLPSSVSSNAQNDPTARKLPTIPTRHETADRNGENTGESRGGPAGQLFSCGNPSRRWRTVSLEEAKFSSQLSEAVSRHLLGPVGRRLRVSNSWRWCTSVGIQRLLLLGCSRLCSSFVQDWRWERREVTGEGSFTVGWWWEMFVVQHSNPPRPPEPLNELLRGHSEDTRGGIKDTQMLQFYRQFSRYYI